ncbi:MAG: fluoride efflux transporter FluC [Bacillus sp. (in: firmicutes)]
MTNAFFIFAGGFLGASMRYICSIVYRRVAHPEAFPWAMVVVNTTGSFLLGLIQHGGLSVDANSFVAIGAISSFTTFSTFSLEAYQLAAQRRNLSLVVYLTVSLVGCAAMYYAGYRIGAL